MSIDILERLNSLRTLINEGEAEEAWRRLKAFCLPDDAGAAVRLRQTKRLCASRIAALAGRRGDNAEAVVWSRRAVECDPQSAWARIALANALSNAGEATEAWALLTDLHDRRARDDVADHIRKAMGFSAAKLTEAANRRRDYVEAVLWGRRAAECDPRSAWARIALANALSNAGEATESWALLTELHDRGAPPDIADRLRKAMGFSAAKLAQAAKAHGASDLELDWRERAVALIPESSHYALALGWAFFGACRFSEAWDVLAKLEESARDDPSVTDGIRKGLAACATALAIDVEFCKGLRSVEGTGWREAARWREAALRRNPDHAAGWCQYALDLVYCGRYADAAAIVAETHSPEIDAKLRCEVGDMPHHVKAQIDSGGSIFRCEAPRYRARGLSVVPALGKVGIPAGWDVWSDRLPDEATYQRWHDIPGANIALVLGRQSGVSVIDIDTEDADLMQVICALLPPSPWQRFGRRGVALAYRRTSVPPQNLWDCRSMAPLFDLLSDASLIVLPPSLHPQTGRPYRAEHDLLDVIDDLPALPDDFIATATAALRAKGCDARARIPRWLERRAALQSTP